MRFNDHLGREGAHAVLSPSNYHWVNYEPEKLTARWRTLRAAQRGTELHEYAAKAIRLRRYQRDDQDSLSLYVNDAIDLGMRPEQTLFYSFNCFGTADAIALHERSGARRRLLRVYDLKTGVAKTSFMQLKIYAAIFCLEYRIKPYSIDYELRIYQHDEVTILDDVDPDEIARVMDKIISSDQHIESLREEDNAW